MSYPSLELGSAAEIRRLNARQLISQLQNIELTTIYGERSGYYQDRRYTYFESISSVTIDSEELIPSDELRSARQRYIDLYWLHSYWRKEHNWEFPGYVYFWMEETIKDCTQLVKKKVIPHEFDFVLKVLEITDSH